jgi:hypothetical protein
MMDGLAFLPVPDLTIGIHLLRTLCPDDPPEAAELLDYFDSTYISGRLRQQNPAQNQAVCLVLPHSPPMFPPAIWNAIVNNRLEEFPVSILTFIWQERIYCSACYIFEWNPDGV